MVSIVDYGIGNLLAIRNIISKVGGNAVITDDPVVIRKSQKLILPGVGAFNYGMEQLKKKGLIDVLNEEVLMKGKVVLGLCLGAQLITQKSDEGNMPGLGWIPGRTVRFNSEAGLVIPHMGWAEVEFVKTSPLWKGIDEARFYFTHSFHFELNSTEYITGVCNYGYKFPCSFEYKNIFGVQFHPEKSHQFGMKFFKNYLDL